MEPGVFSCDGARGLQTPGGVNLGTHAGSEDPASTSEAPAATREIARRFEATLRWEPARHYSDGILDVQIRHVLSRAYDLWSFSSLSWDRRGAANTLWATIRLLEDIGKPRVRG